MSGQNLCHIFFIAAAPHTKLLSPQLLGLGIGIMASVLIVEDEQTDRIILGSILEGVGHDVYFASGGEKALKVYAGRSIDVIVTDLQMPHVDGLELIVALQALFPDVAIIVVSGMGPKEFAAAKNKGALVAFSKPVDPDELLQAIADVAPDSLGVAADK